VTTEMGDGEFSDFTDRLMRAAKTHLADRDFVVCSRTERWNVVQGTVAVLEFLPSGSGRHLSVRVRVYGHVLIHVERILSASSDDDGLAAVLEDPDASIQWTLGLLELVAVHGAQQLRIRPRIWPLRRFPRLGRLVTRLGVAPLGPREVVVEAWAPWPSLPDAPKQEI
jgi:hypothetical protein